MTIENLLPEERTLLEKKYFWLWTVYKRMLTGLVITFGSLWIWLGWEAWHDHSLAETFGIISVVILVLAVFGGWSTPVYRKRHALPLENDLAQNQKICKTGLILAIERENKYTNRIIFREHGQTATEVFILNDDFRDLYHLNREITLAHTPQARMIVHARLIVPFTEEEIKEQKKEAIVNLVGIFILLGILMVGMGWLFDLLLVCTLLYLVAIALISGIVWWDDLKPDKKKQKINEALRMGAVNVIATLIFMVIGKLILSELIWKINDRLDWDSEAHFYLLLGLTYVVFSALVNLIWWYYKQSRQSQ